MLSGLLTPVILTALGSESHHLSASYYDNTVGVCLLFFMLLDSFPSIVALGFLASVSFLSLPLTALWAVLLLGQQLLFKKMSRAVVAHSLVLMGVIFMSIAPHFEWQQYVPLYATDSVAIHDLSVSSGNDTTQVDKGRTTIERPIVIQTRWQKLPVIARKIRYHAWEQELTPISYTTSMWGEDFGVSIAADGGLRVFYRPFVRVIWMMMLGLSSLFLWTVYAPVMTQLGMVIKSWLFKIYSLWFGNSQKSIIRPLVFLKSTLLPDNLSKSLF
jgi:cytochrome c biogenesis factor